MHDGANTSNCAIIGARYAVNVPPFKSTTGPMKIWATKACMICVPFAYNATGVFIAP